MGLTKRFMLIFFMYISVRHIEKDLYPCTKDILGLYEDQGSSY